MRNANSFGLHFNLRTEKERDGKAPIYVGITVNGRRVFAAQVRQTRLKRHCIWINPGVSQLITGKHQHYRQ